MSIMRLILLTPLIFSPLTTNLQNSFIKTGNLRCEKNLIIPDTSEWNYKYHITWRVVNIHCRQWFSTVKIILPPWYITSKGQHESHLTIFLMWSCTSLHKEYFSLEIKHQKFFSKQMWAIKLHINIKQITTVILQVISWEIILKKKRKIVCLLLNYYTIMFIFNPYLQENISSKSRPLFNIHELRSVSVLSWCSLQLRNYTTSEKKYKLT